MVVPPRTPTCRLSGTIVRVDFEEEHVREDWEARGAQNPPGWVPGTTSPARYVLRILVREVTYVEGDEGEETCEGRYVPGREDVFTIHLSGVRPGDAFRVGSPIEAVVWNGHLTSYALPEER